MTAASSTLDVGESRSGLRRRLSRFRGVLNARIWESRLMLRYGRPHHVVRFLGGLGDELMSTALFREWRRRGLKGLWMMTSTPELFRGNPDIDAIVPVDYRIDDLVRRIGGELCDLQYARLVPDLDMDELPDCHVITRMCQLAKLTGEHSARPYLHLSASERHAGRLALRQIAIQTSGSAARFPMRTKEWYPDRFQEVVTRLQGEFDFVQVGSTSDPALDGVIDMRGCPVRETAGILAGSLAFVGLEGFLMHLARAVERRSVIVIGGRIPPWQFGYQCNVNLVEQPGCSPCWLRDRCPHDRECMRRIDAQRVIDAIRRVALQSRGPIEDERADIPPFRSDSSPSIEAVRRARVSASRVVNTASGHASEGTIV